MSDAPHSDAPDETLNDHAGQPYPKQDGARPTSGVKAGGVKLEGRRPGQRSATISVLVENEAGVLARVIGLFSGRGYNIDSLTVAPVDESGRQSRINVVTSGTDMVIEQIKAQLDRLVPVHRVADLSLEGPHLARELAMIKVVGTGPARAEALRLGDAFRARVIDATTDSFVFELTGATEKLDAFIALMRPLGLSEVSRTGIAAIARGTRLL